MKAKQSNFFDVIPGKQGTVIKFQDNRWQATIAGGYWMAYGRTKADAIKRVTKLFERE